MDIQSKQYREAITFPVSLDDLRAELEELNRRVAQINIDIAVREKEFDDIVNQWVEMSEKGTAAADFDYESAGQQVRQLELGNLHREKAQLDREFKKKMQIYKVRQEFQ